MNNLLKYIMMFLNIVFSTHTEPVETDINHVITLVKLFCTDTIRAINAPFDIVSSHVCALYYKHYAENGTMPLSLYAYFYCIHKISMFEKLHDFGAWGDILECLTRCALKRNIHLCRITDFHAAGFDKNDIVSKTFGIVEVGHNGKSLMSSMPNNYMYGDYQTFIYGVFDDLDKSVIMDYITSLKLDRAIQYVSESMRVWRNKYEFIYDINHISKGAGIVWKKSIGAAQIIYNPSKHKAFLANCNTPSLSEILDTL